MEVTTSTPRECDDTSNVSPKSMSLLLGPKMPKIPLALLDLRASMMVVGVRAGDRGGKKLFSLPIACICICLHTCPLMHITYMKAYFICNIYITGCSDVHGCVRVSAMFRSELCPP
jgi:hypothetical protein